MKVSTELRARMEKAMHEFIEANCDDPCWIDASIGDDTASIMASSAITVLEAVVDHERYLTREQMLKP